MPDAIIDGRGEGNTWGIDNNNAGLVSVTGSDGTTADVKNNVNTTNNELLVNLEGHQCPENTTIIPLGADEVFLGSDWQDALDYGVLSIAVGSDQDSAVDGLEVQWSTDGINPIVAPDIFTIFANIGKTFTFGPAARYYRVKYTNGSTPQGSFYLVSLLRRNYVKPSSHRINESIVGEDDAELVKAVLTGIAPDGLFKNVQVTNAGNQKISIEEYDDAFETSPFPSKISIGDEKRNVTYEDTSFVTGDSPIVLDIETDLGRTGIDGYIINDGGGDIQVELSNDGTLYGDITTLKDADVYDLQGVTVSKIRLTWVNDTAYRVNVI